MAKKDNTNLIIGLVAVGLLVVGVALYLSKQSKHHSNGGGGVCCAVSDYPNCSVNTAGAAVTKDACSGTALQGKCNWLEGKDKCPGS